MMFIIGFICGIWAIVIFRIVQKRRRNKPMGFDKKIKPVKVNDISIQFDADMHITPAGKQMLDNAFEEFQKEYGDHS